MAELTSPAEDVQHVGLLPCLGMSREQATRPTRCQHRVGTGAGMGTRAVAGEGLVCIQVDVGVFKLREILIREQAGAVSGCGSLQGPGDDV